MTRSLHAVLFDLDGTLLDTAPDMIGALNVLRAERELQPLPYDQVRSSVSHGTARVVKVGFPEAEPQLSLALQQRFLEIYRDGLSRDTRLFPGMEQVLDTLARWRLKSGVVTNKPGWLTEPLLLQLGIRQRFACVVSGDTVAERKPHPMPLLHAAALAEVAPGACIYVGDAQRDVQAAHAAAMPAVVADYGYLGPEDDSSAWGADAHLRRPLDLLHWLEASARL